MAPNLSLMILFAEDDASAREITPIILATEGHRVLPATNGSVAWDMLVIHPDVDLLISDILMPGGINGMQLTERATAAFPSLKVIQLSGDYRGSNEPFPEHMLSPQTVR
ncbi:response regulator [Dyella sp. 20L07]|uniref:response regulator n=1 Tax=Dyella sp. 20L07 TaxID=3384240 RepID=UPI003D2C8BEE